MVKAGTSSGYMPKLRHY
ncbi:DUF3704 domain-containing protein [Cytobacillus praedii]|uniref:DUF3704 domain-containing protein n=1 Tax=Cytobacillus praedii TaxID=1742358 RepID=A0A4R1AUM7_9BACI|nr:DUF3704 domain-containing protein [Cytobacillus praedii]